MQQLFATGVVNQTRSANVYLRNFSLLECLIVVSPPEDLGKEIMSIKRHFASKHNYKLACATKPHITIAKFLQVDSLLERLISQLHKITSYYSSFEINLKNYSCFTSEKKNTIYIGIEDKYPILRLARGLKRTQYLMHNESRYKPEFTSNPHLTIARGLERWRFDKAWLDYQNTMFSGTFTASNTILLHRPVGDQKYTIADQFDLLGIPSFELKQGLLF